MVGSVCTGGLIQEHAGNRGGFARQRGAGRGQNSGALFADGGGLAVVDIGGGVQAEADVALLRVVPSEETLAVGPATSIEVKREGNPGRYLRVLNCASE